MADSTTAHLVGGYYLVQGICQEVMPLLPKPFWSLSSCLSTTLPGLDGLSWMVGDERSKAAYMAQLHLSEVQYRELSAWTDAHFESGDIGWPDVFLSLDAALAFRDKFLVGVADVKLLLLAAPESHLEQATEDFVSICGDSELGVLTQLKKKQPAPSRDWKRLGYEVLGAEIGGHFHSFACNQLDEDYQSRLGIKLNRNGLIDSLADAERAATYTMSPDVGAEPVLWLPWLVLEHTPSDGSQVADEQC